MNNATSNRRTAAATPAPEARMRVCAALLQRDPGMVPFRGAYPNHPTSSCACHESTIGGPHREWVGMDEGYTASFREGQTVYVGNAKTLATR